MSRTVLVLLVVGVVLAIVPDAIMQKSDLLPPIICKKNEEWVECATACPPTCEQREPGICIAMCSPGCQCKPGFLRNRHNECVRPCDCD
ncbi:chymotrypsin inhibitor-like [Odontomachus brunneus]|uniref:chymotrypsin inhibitor-like n=1 Tax=Odontomachus brunneus TaxID=486640 RepID=UPI0013F201C3|nr:chymotrypsin inhibitor-like [Odontomachus brunneus]